MEKMIWSGQGPVEVGIYDPVNGTAAMGFLTKLREVGCATRQLTTSLAQEKKPIKETCSGSRESLHFSLAIHICTHTRSTHA